MRLKDICILGPQYVGEVTNDIVSFVPMDCLRMGHIYLDNTINLKLGKRKYTYFADGDLLIAKVTPCFENGNIAIASGLKNGIGFGSSEFFVLRANNKKVLNMYLFYVALSSMFQDKACATMCGVGGLKRISPLFMQTYELEIPGKTKQFEIIKYLDNKIDKIDSHILLLSKKRNSYTKLRQAVIDNMTNSGLNFSTCSNIHIGDDSITKWKRYRIKDIAYLYSGLIGKSGDDFRSGDISKQKPFIPYTNILNNTYINECQFNYVVLEDGENQNIVKRNDLLFLMSSEDYGSIAKTAVVKNDVGELYLNSFCKGVRFYDEKLVYAPFVNYQLSSTKFRDYLRLEARGFTRINIKVDKISSMFVYLPPLEEQKAIVSYLDEKCAKIDTIICNINIQIDKLQSLKKSLINEVISGKRTV